MRRGPTAAEAVMWSVLRRSNLGTRFRRQEPIGPYVVDFVSLRARLVIELDGQVHFEGRGDRERERDRFLRSRGFRVLHIENHVVHDRPEIVLEEVRRLVRDKAAEPLDFR